MSRRPTLRQRLLALLVGGLALSVVASFLLALVYTRGTLRQGLLKSLQTQVQVLSESLAADLDFGAMASGRRSIDAFLTNPEIVAVQLADRDGRPFAIAVRPGETADFAALPGPGEERHAFAGGHLDYVTAIRHAGQRKGALFLRASLAGIDAQFRRTVWVLSLGSAALLLVLFLIAGRALRGVTGPILELAATARRVSASHDYGLRMAEGRAEETGVLARAFNEMLERIQAQDRRLSEQIRQLDEDLQARRRIEERGRELEQELQHLQRLESVGRLAGGVAHDMNNVLAAIMAVSSLIEDRHAEDPATARNIQSIQAAAERGRDLIRSLLEFARKDLQAKAPIDLNELVRKEADLLRSTTFRKVAIELDLQEPLPCILGEASALSNVLMNLCVNAVDAMPHGGRLTLRTSMPAPGVVEMVVEDTGHGMSPEVRQRALEPFFTTKPVGKGTGLGLAVVFGTVKAHGGSLDIQSEPGRGTRVRVQLPATLAPPGEAAAPPAAAVGGAFHLLLVDDDPMIQQSVPRMLETLGHRVEVATRGQDCLARLASGLLPDLVILDMNMPGMNGLETLRQLRARYPRLPVIVGSGHIDAEVAQSLREHALVHPLPKPYGRREIQAAILHALGRTED